MAGQVRINVYVQMDKTEYETNFGPGDPYLALEEAICKQFEVSNRYGLVVPTHAIGIDLEIDEDKTEGMS